MKDTFCFFLFCGRSYVYQNSSPSGNQTPANQEDIELVEEEGERGEGEQGGGEGEGGEESVPAEGQVDKQPENSPDGENGPNKGFIQLTYIKAAHFSIGKSDCLGCAVLICLVVCTNLLATFFLPSIHHACVVILYMLDLLFV